MPRAVDERFDRRDPATLRRKRRADLGARVEQAAARRPRRGRAPSVRGAEKALRDASAATACAFWPCGILSWCCGNRGCATSQASTKWGSVRWQGRWSPRRSCFRRKRTSPGSTIPNASMQPRARISPLRFAPGLRASDRCGFGRGNRPHQHHHAGLSPCGAVEALPRSPQHVLVDARTVPALKSAE